MARRQASAPGGRVSAVQGPLLLACFQPSPAPPPPSTPTRTLLLLCPPRPASSCCIPPRLPAALRAPAAQIPVPEGIDVLLVEQEVVGTESETALQAVVAADVELMELRRARWGRLSPSGTRVGRTQGRGRGVPAAVWLARARLPP